MKKPVFWSIIVALSVLGFVVKNWQCQEMFPDANRVACLFWK